MYTCVHVVKLGFASNEFWSLSVSNPSNISSVVLIWKDCEIPVCLSVTGVCFVRTHREQCPFVRIVFIDRLWLWGLHLCKLMP